MLQCSVILALLIAAVIATTTASASSPLAPSPALPTSVPQPRPDSKAFVMPWMCLQRCHFTIAEVEDHIAQIAAKKDVITAVAFERFNLGPNSTLIRNRDLYKAAPPLQKLGFPTVPMVSSFPYPPAFLSWMRELFSNPTPFIEDLLGASLIEGHSAVNLDFEPTANATAEDANNYARFLHMIQTRFAPFGIGVTVDVATWSIIWDLKAMAAALRSAPKPTDFTTAQITANRQRKLTSLLRKNPTLGAEIVQAVVSAGAAAAKPVGPFIATMETYTAHYPTFHKNLLQAVEDIGRDMLTIGLMVAVNKSATPDDFVEKRFKALREAKVRSVAVWKMPLPERWWAPLTEFVKGQ